MPAKPLTPEQQEDSGRLKTLFRNWQTSRAARNLPWSQDWCSEQLEFGQSAVAQYLNAKIPLNPEAARKFAKLIDVQVEAFSPTIAAEISKFSGSTAELRRFDEAITPVGNVGELMMKLVDALSFHDLGTREGAAAFVSRGIINPESAIKMAIQLDRILAASEDEKQPMVNAAKRKA